MSPNYNKPIPSPQGESDFYWQKAKDHELWIRKCNHCNRAYFYPRDISPCCFSRNTSWIKASGEATLFSYGIVHRSPHPAFNEDSPYVVAIVQLAEGPKMPTNIITQETPTPENIRIGMPLQVIFEDISDEISLVKFTPIT